MSPEVKAHLVNRVLTAPVATGPFPHFYCESVFPDAFYDEILAHLPSLAEYRSYPEAGKGKKKTGDKYKDRYTVMLNSPEIERIGAGKLAFWQDMTELLTSQEYGEALLYRFHPYFEAKFGDRIPSLRFVREVQLLCDRTGFSLGPHTDSVSKVAVMLFYLPAGDDREDLGTSIYAPKDGGFTCPGVKHHDFEDFERIYTAPYRRNAAFGFFKTDNSFHGVEYLLDDAVERNLIQFSILVDG